MKLRLPLLAAIAVLAATADARPLKPEQEAMIKPEGKPVSCIPIHQIRSSQVRDDSTIDFYMNNRKVFRNKLPSSCPSLGFQERFGYSTSISQLCSTDIITVLFSGPGVMPGASCGLGQFQPVTGAPK